MLSIVNFPSIWFHWHITNVECIITSSLESCVASIILNAWFKSKINSTSFEKEYFQIPMQSNQKFYLLFILYWQRRTWKDWKSLHLKEKMFCENVKDSTHSQSKGRFIYLLSKITYLVELQNMLFSYRICNFFTEYVIFLQIM